MPSDPVTSIPKTTTTTTLRHAWRQTRVYWDQSPRLRGAYLAAYLVFFCGFLFFPSSKSHNNFFYAALLAPSLIMLGHLFSDFWKHRVFRLIMIYVLFLVLTGLWGENVSVANIARQVKHLLYVLAFLTASIVIEACYPRRGNRVLTIFAWACSLSFLVSILWWYQAHAFPATRLRMGDMLGHMDNPILAGCIAGVACMALLDTFRESNQIPLRVAIGAGCFINLAFILLSQSRTALAALIPALLILAIPYFRRHGYLALSAGAVAVVILLFQDALFAALIRNSYRIDVWLATLEKVPTSLWWGKGYFCDTFALRIDGKDMLHAHNVYLATLRDGGIVGLAVLVGMVSAAVYRAWRQSQATKHYLTLALLIYGLTAGFFDNDRLIDNPEELWIFFWYPFCRVIAYDLVHAGHLNMAHR